MPQPSVDKTLFDKIWDAHYVATRPDDRDLVYIDRHVLHELHAPHAFEKLAKTKRGVRRPDLYEFADRRQPRDRGNDDGDGLRLGRRDPVV